MQIEFLRADLQHWERITLFISRGTVLALNLHQYFSSLFVKILLLLLFILRYRV